MWFAGRVLYSLRGTSRDVRSSEHSPPTIPPDSTTPIGQSPRSCYPGSFCPEGYCPKGVLFSIHVAMGMRYLRLPTTAFMPASCTSVKSIFNLTMMNFIVAAVSDTCRLAGWPPDLDSICRVLRSVPDDMTGIAGRAVHQPVRREIAYSQRAAILNGWRA